MLGEIFLSGPNTEAVENFLAMIWRIKIKCVVMINQVFENGRVNKTLILDLDLLFDKGVKARSHLSESRSGSKIGSGNRCLL